MNMNVTSTNQAKRAFKRRVRHFAHKIGVNVQTLALRPMARKWASCSTKGNLNFNLDLLAVDADLQDYVIVHELVHVLVPNHGKLWKMLMCAYVGDDYEEREERLKQIGRAQKER